MITSTRPRQAVVLIHGIGDQMPMTTLRGFVQAVIAEEQKGGAKGKWQVYSEADQTDETFELHTFTVVPPEDADPRVPRTDFYEGYWAEEVRGTRLAHVWRWVFRVFKTGLVGPPRRLRWLYALAVGLAVLFAAAALALILTPVSQTVLGGPAGVALKAAVAVVAGAASGWLITSLGDFARYTDDHPDNVDMRQAIRQRLVGLLDKLHDDGRYGRIVVVGHSLGGIVGYDALRLLWAKRTGGDTGDIPGQADDHAVALAAGHLADPGGLGNFCTSQYGLCEDLGSRRIPVWKTVKGQPQSVQRPAWLVTDLVTLGSPIAYPELLLADGDPAEYRSLVEERQLPKCPPTEVGQPGSGYRYHPADPAQGRRYHHGSMFAATRWFNAYRQGDFAGGPVTSDTLGAGVVNQPIAGGLPVLSHSSYWKNRESLQIIRLVINHPEKCHEGILHPESN